MGVEPVIDISKVNEERDREGAERQGGWQQEVEEVMERRGRSEGPAGAREARLVEARERAGRRQTDG